MKNTHLEVEGIRRPCYSFSDIKLRKSPVVGYWGPKISAVQVVAVIYFSAFRIPRSAFESKIVFLWPLTDHAL